MENDEQYLEDNIKRLIQVGFSLPPKPNPQMKELTWQRLVSQLGTKQKCMGFPDGTLVILACTRVWMAIWVVKRILSVGLAATLIPSLELIHVVLALNLLCVPVAGIVVVVARRRYIYVE